MKPQTLLIRLLVVAAIASGWLVWLSSSHSSTSDPAASDAAFAALERETTELRQEVEELEKRLESQQQNSKGDLAIPTVVGESLDKNWPEHPPFPPLQFSTDQQIFQANLKTLKVLLPASTFTQLLKRCGLIDDHESFIRQLALVRSEGARAVAGEQVIHLVEGFDIGSIPDQAALVGALHQFWLDRSKPNHPPDNRAIQTDLTLRAAAQIAQTQFLLNYARQGEAMLQPDNSARTPIEELPIAIQACIEWQARRQLDIDSELTQALRNGSYQPDPRRIGLGPIFTALVLNPTASENAAPQPTGESLAKARDSSIHWQLDFAQTAIAQEAETALSLYFSDWPLDFGKPPQISREEGSLKLHFPAIARP